jgi:glycosyltransferase involved in cell wall biosynthesis
MRILSIIEQLASRHEVALISFVSEPAAGELVAALRRYCRSVEVAQYRPFQPSRLKALLGYFSARPRSVIDTYSAEMGRLVERAAREFAPDVVIASEIDMAPYALAVPGARKILEDLELASYHDHFITQSQRLRKLRSGLTWWKTSHYVASLLRVFDGCTVVSEQERWHVRQIAPGYRAIGIVPNGVNLRAYDADPVAPASDTLIYAGALSYDANFDAADFFLRDIWPLIRAERPDVQLSITGRLDGVPIERLALSDRVSFTGYLSDIRPAIARSWASIVPLRNGSGTRLKILESLAIGTPVVATSKGAEGLDLAPERDILIADTPADFAAAVLRLLGDPALRETLRRNGRRAIESNYDWRIIGRRLNEFVEQVAKRAEAETIQPESPITSGNR